MVNYRCDKCGKEFEKKSNYSRHMNKKNPCIKNSFKCELCNETFSTKSDYDRHMNKKIPCTEKIGSYGDTKHVCKICEKEFSSYTTLYTHVKSKTCSKKKELQPKQNIQNNNNNMTNNIDTVNNNNIENVNVDGDVKVVKFGNENLSYMTDDLYKQILGRGIRSVQEFIEHSNFHKDHPENHNIYIANIRDEYIVFFDGDKWSITDRDEKMEDIIYARSDRLIVKFKELSGEMDPRDVIKFEKFMKKRYDDDVMSKMKKELTLQFYNNRYLPKRQRKKMEIMENKAIRDSVVGKHITVMNKIKAIIAENGDNTIDRIKKIIDEANSSR